MDKKDVQIVKEVVKAAAGYSGKTTKAMKLLLGQQRGNVKIRHEHTGHVMQ